jgi:HTH-type transcriptional regulator, competence development regulator
LIFQFNQLFLSKFDKSKSTSQYMHVSFGQYIKKLRTDNGLTLTQLAALLDLDSANLSKIENGKRDFDAKRLGKLSIALNVDFEKLKSEYYSDFVAQKLYESNCNEEILALAEKKVQYLREKNSRQGTLNL